jgi:RES domain
MAVFVSCGSYLRFEHVVRSELRYVRPADIEDFLETVLATAKSREERLKSGAVLWRAQRGHVFREHSSIPDLIVEVPSPFLPERMKPLADRAKEGRANPKGIPVLYLATERETALSEVRPWLGSLVSIAQFELKRDLRVIDCSVGSARMPIWPQYAPEDPPPPPEVRERSVWTDIDLRFAEPVDRSDDVADYASTQIIAELFKREKYDGIKYRSAFSDTGHNVALFDTTAAEVVPASCALFQTKRMNFEFALCDNDR